MPSPVINQILFGGQKTRVFVNSSYVEQTVSGSNPVTFPTGAKEGDILGVLWHNVTTAATSAPTMPSGTRPFTEVFLSQSVGGWNLSFHYIALTAADILTGTFTPGSGALINAAYVMFVYRGPTVFSTTNVRVAAAADATTLDLTNLTIGGPPGRQTAGVLAIVGNQTARSSPTTQSGWTTRLSNVGAVYLTWSAFDLPPVGYTGGTTTFSPFGTGAGQPYGVLLEMQF